MRIAGRGILSTPSVEDEVDPMEARMRRSVSKHNYRCHIAHPEIQIGCVGRLDSRSVLLLASEMSPE